jgi:CubicO group peptidase (beta-lactamase class C family)
MGSGLIVAVVCWFGAAHEAAFAEVPISFPPATPESQGIPAAAMRRLSEEIARYVKTGMSVGGELLIIKNRKTILHEVYGDRDREDKLPMELNTIFNIRSMTKPFTGVAIQILVDEGKIKLDDRVAKYLPGFDNDKSRDITIKQLLEHRSGLPLTVNLVLNGFKNLQAQAEAAGKSGPQFKPGEKFWYSDAGSDCAAAVVEKVSGVTIDHFVSERILKPLGMADSFYPTKADDPRKQRIASLYIGRPGKWTRFWKPGGNPMYTFAWGSQTLYATPADYARFLTLWLDGGKVAGKKLLSKEAVTRILTPASSMTTLGIGTPYPTGFDGMRPWYGQMSMLYVTGNDAKGKVIGFGHGGSDGTVAWAFPAEDLIVCYFTQSRGQVTTVRIEATIQDALLHRSEAVKMPDNLKPYLGTFYANVGPYKNTEFHILFRNGHLALDIPDQLIYELKPPDKDGYWQFAITNAVSVSFKKDEHGKVASMILYQGGMSFELPRDKPVRPEPITKEAAAKYLGQYQRDEDKVVVEVSWKDGGLAIRTAGEKNELGLVQRPDKKSWQPRQPSGAVTIFNEDKSGKVISFITELPDGRKLTRRRVER